MKIKDALEILENIAFFLEIKDENIFKINAFKNSVRVLSHLNLDLAEGLKSGEIENIKGVGKSIFSVLEEISEKGNSSLLIELQKDIPKSLLDLKEINGLGPKKIKKIYNSLGISNLIFLEKACIENKLVALEGFGEKVQEKILKEINRIKRFKGYILLNEAYKIDKKLHSEIFINLDSNFIKPTGEFRRKCEIISKLEYLISKKEFILLQKVDCISLTKISDSYYNLKYENYIIGINLTIEEEFNSQLLRTTGPVSFVSTLTNIDKFMDEEQIFRLNDQDFVEPELRDNEALYNKRKNLITLEDIKGVLHVHTNYSDGINTIRELRNESEKLGYEYILISDHSKTSVYANGLKVERLFEQWKEIEDLNKENKNIKILKGIECDILPDGSLDYDDNILEKFDCVIASVHSSFTQNVNDMTKRVCKALENKFVRILGHSTGRLLLSREGYEIDIERIIEKCAELNKVIEINCDPHRMDLDWRFHQKAISNRVKLAINPDAHSLNGLDYIKLGIDIARKGGLEKSDVINTLDYRSFIKEYCNNV